MDRSIERLFDDSKNKVRYSKKFKTEIEAAIWYNKKAIELHGEFANLNIIKNV